MFKQIEHMAEETDLKRNVAMVRRSQGRSIFHRVPQFSGKLLSDIQVIGFLTYGAL